MCSVMVWRDGGSAAGQRAFEGLCAAVENMRGGSKRRYNASVTVLRAVQVCFGGSFGINTPAVIRADHESGKQCAAMILIACLALQDAAGAPGTAGGGDLWLLNFSDRPRHICMVQRCDPLPEG